VGKIFKCDSLYKVEGTAHLLASTHTVNSALTATDAHWQLGHISLDTIKSLICEGAITSLDVLELSLPISCDSCIYGKMMRKPSPMERVGCRMDSFSGKVHTDVWGPSMIRSLGGKTYYVSFTDDKMRYMHLYPLTQKSGVFEAYLGFEAWAQTHHNAKILTL